ncbi:DASH complex subunit Dad3 [Schizosaccharomyces japonicus yFS275]|uniref:DASH complex subunit DAD3 n=1 Tax=Schizosaccharomyces japonicus (strain yFS275 / FY16936) TaxID=402676 RepID=B6K484_SCHJY|nr:DASH complex subunit Dad3 [Schizosaccharomyces japonicus yFS275]EEB08291.1 DASH complex subunit Dad3 [Schizosaccharomyces japonicus yFS275]
MSSSTRDLEQQVLQEYSKLAKNTENLANVLRQLVNNSSSESLDTFRELEKKAGLVYTLFKASIWAILADLENAQEEASGSQSQN